MILKQFKNATKLLSTPRKSLSTEPELVNSFKETAKKLIDTHVNPKVLEYEKAGIAPLHEIFKKFGDAGLLGISHPEEYGGLGLPYSVNIAVCEEFGGIDCGAIPMALGVQTDMATPGLAKHGSDELRENFLAPCIAGDMVSCIGVSEPHAGSDVGQTKTTATLNAAGTEYTINGGKIWTTNVTQADWMCCLVNTEKDAKSPYRAKSLIIIPLKSKGVTITSQDMEKLGMRSSDWGQTYFDNVKVPASHVIGEPGQGFYYQMAQFQKERLYTAAGLIKPFQKLISKTAEYCRDRQVFGQPLLKNQHIQYKLAELATDTELFRLALYRTCEKLDAGEDVTREASMLKLKAGQLIRTLPDTCLQFHGAQGYLFDSYVCRMHRDLRGSAIGAGADEVMMQVIAKMEGFHI